VPLAAAPYAAIRSPDPVVVLEPKVLYRSPREEVPEGCGEDLKLVGGVLEVLHLAVDEQRRFGREGVWMESELGLPT
jgi:hypothetical protein